MGSIPTAPANFGPVAQSVRALACHARGRGFEPHLGRHFNFIFAVIAQQAEHFLGKEEVDSSNLFNSSIYLNQSNKDWFFCGYKHKNNALIKVFSAFLLAAFRLNKTPSSTRGE